MIYPSSIYKGIRSDVAPSRINWIEIQGKDQPELYYTMKRIERGQKSIKLMRPFPKKGSNNKRASLGLFQSNGISISNVNEPDITRPGYGFGDINNRKDAILTIRDEEARTLVIMVFDDLGMQAEELFQYWATGGICEHLPNNKLDLSTESVTEP